MQALQLLILFLSVVALPFFIGHPSRLFPVSLLFGALYVVSRSPKPRLKPIPSRQAGLVCLAWFLLAACHTANVLVDEATGFHLFLFGPLLVCAIFFAILTLLEALSRSTKHESLDQKA